MTSPTTINFSAPLFSIITITKDNFAGIKKTLVSLSDQSCDAFEWIVVDGGTDKQTQDLIANLSETLKQKCVSIHEPDNGLYDAMNKGIDRARGDYLLFLNAGDALADADLLSTLAHAIESEQPDFIYGDALEDMSNIPHPFYKKARSHTKIAYGMFTHHQAMLYKRSVIGDLRYDIRYRIAADYKFTYQHLMKSRQIHYSPCALCVFESGGVSQTQPRKGRQEQSDIRRSLGISSAAENAILITAQRLSSFLKKNAPKLYIFLKTKH